MTNGERIEHFRRWNERNRDVTDDLSWNVLLELYDIFKNTNPEYAIVDWVEEHEGTELNDKYNEFAAKYYKFNRFLNGRWEERF